jgi:uncharacterized protein (TIGR02145 family)
MVINHLSGATSPVNKTVTYNTVTNIPGEPAKCWITSNLGADHPATSVSDATEASAGWYWQFNRKQGFLFDVIMGRIPNTSWVQLIYEDSDWQAINDPCSLELGDQWRLPTNAEWFNVDNAGGWNSSNGPRESGLKLHAAGYLDSYGGTLYQRGFSADYWSSTQYDNYNGWHLHISGGSSTMIGYKSTGFSVRCIRE